MAEELHVLHVVGEMNIGGIENMLMTLMPYMREKGIIFDFAVHGETVGIYEQKIKDFGGKVYHLPKFIGINFMHYLSSWRKLIVLHPELKIIHGHMTSTASLYLWLAKRYGRITLAHSHSTSTSGGRVVSAVKRCLEYPLRYISDYLCACSNDAAQYRFGKFSYSRNNFFLWHNAITTENFKYSEEKRKIYREKLGIDEHTTVIGHVGRMVPAKNHKFLMEIFATYRQFNSDTKLLLVGDGFLRKSIEKQAVSIGVNSDVIFTGAVLNSADYLSSMDMFCFPSKHEGLAVSLIEAQINGLPCIASDYIPKEAVISDKIWFMKSTQHALGWATRIKDIMEEKNNRFKPIINPYDVWTVADEVSKFYKNII